MRPHLAAGPWDIPMSLSVADTQPVLTARLIVNLVGGQYTTLHPSLSKPTTPTAARKKPQLRIGFLGRHQALVTPDCWSLRLHCCRSWCSVVARGVPSSLVVFRCCSWCSIVARGVPSSLVVLEGFLGSVPCRLGPIITIQQSSNINQITGNSNTEHRSKRIQRRIEQGDDSNSSNPPLMESNQWCNESYTRIV
ncbi:hypothetical protein PGT21_015285 [Puccinia graminis f. sp. tritici]|uniref:Uncharacterized protein n=1 Tax=Puccinia graminis f. sp. tritici TaxID=56615 RepID=A0A5B0LPQ5_PUCGR|nr:hypothetical protein PGT21_015285 [Puccinia graminis f. sp. tritici]